MRGESAADKRGWTRNRKIRGSESASIRVNPRQLFHRLAETFAVTGDAAACDLWMKRATAFAIALACLISSSAFAETISVAAAISMKDALAKVAGKYKAEAGDVVEFTLGASGQLASQIQYGRRSTFSSPRPISRSTVLRRQILSTKRPGGSSRNALVLIVPASSNTAPNSIGALNDPSITRIAIGEPKTVPAGQYAQQTLIHEGVLDAVKQKLVFGTNVRQVLGYVERGEVSAGLVYETDAMQSGSKVKMTYRVDEADHDPILYPGAIVTASKKKPAARDFLITFFPRRDKRSSGILASSDLPSLQPGQRHEP